jgi:hypothetical protein
VEVPVPALLYEMVPPAITTLREVHFASDACAPVAVAVSSYPVAEVEPDLTAIV